MAFCTAIASSCLMSVSSSCGTGAAVGADVGTASVVSVLVMVVLVTPSAPFSTVVTMERPAAGLPGDWLMAFSAAETAADLIWVSRSFSFFSSEPSIFCDA